MYVILCFTKFVSVFLQFQISNSLNTEGHVEEEEVVRSVRMCKYTTSCFIFFDISEY